MKRKTLYMVLLIVLCTALLLSACGSRGKANSPAAVDLKSLDGVYTEEIARRGILQLTAIDENSAQIVVDWPSSAFQSSHWEMSGTYDVAKNAIVYQDCTLTEQSFDETGAETDVVAYTDGTGSFAIDNGKLSWTDDASVIKGSSSTFVYVMSAEDYAKQQGTATPAPVETPAVSATPAPTATPTVSATPAPEATPAPTATPTVPSPTPVVDAASLPKITKSPTNETVNEGGHCYFLARYENAIWAVWHFVSPDGTRDLTYEEASKEFAKLQIEGGEYSQMKLVNVPADLNGWKVYCRYSNRSGYSDTAMATITVNAAAGGTATAGGVLPKVTKSPTSETVNPGGSAIFQARYEDAIWVVWHFVSPDGTRDLDYKEAGQEFPKLEILNGEYSQLMLKNIPSELSGWKVYARYSNHAGYTDTAMATITVNGAGTAAPTTTNTNNNANTTTAGLPKVTKSPTSETVDVGGHCYFLARYEDAIWAVWHFVSPDGTRDLDYKEAAKEFAKLQIEGGEYSQMKLSNIPAELNGWKVYCRYSNRVGYTDTASASITVRGTAAPATSPAPGNANVVVTTPDPNAGSGSQSTANSTPAPYVADWTSVSDFNQAVSGSGVSFTPPVAEALPAGMSVQGYRYKTGGIEVRYGDASGNVLTVRKSTSESGNALSGDTNIYTSAWQISLKGVTVTCKGDGTTINAATFGSAGSNYAITYNTAKEGSGLTPDQINSIVNGMQ